jgi:hypothetical protein
MEWELLSHHARDLVECKRFLVSKVTCPKDNNLICIVGGGIQGPLGTAATNDLLCQLRVIMIMEKSMEWLARETEVLGENLPQCHFVHHKPHMLPVREPEPPRWEAND